MPKTVDDPFATLLSATQRPVTVPEPEVEVAPTPPDAADPRLAILSVRVEKRQRDKLKLVALRQGISAQALMEQLLEKLQPEDTIPRPPPAPNPFDSLLANANPEVMRSVPPVPLHPLMHEDRTIVALTLRVQKRLRHKLKYLSLQTGKSIQEIIELLLSRL